MKNSDAHIYINIHCMNVWCVCMYVCVCVWRGGEATLDYYVSSYVDELKVQFEQSRYNTVG